MTRQAIRSKRVVTPEGSRPACVVFENDRIVAVEKHDVELSEFAVMDAGDLYVLPGLVDSHVHVNEPGRTEWEGFATASRAAAAGGCTCFVDMPLNSIPATINVPALEQKRNAAAASLVDYAFWGGVVKGNAADLLPLAEAGVKGFKCFLVDSGVPEFSKVDEYDLRVAMPLIAQTGLPLLIHAEDSRLIAAQQQIPGDRRKYSSYVRSRPPEAETLAIELITRLCREFGCRTHIVHVSSAASVNLLRHAKAEGLPISAETCPHYLYFAAEQIADGATQFKCAPPIRSASDRELLWEALREGVLDLIATDHSPCPAEMKRFDSGDFFKAWGGIASLSLTLPVVWSGARRRAFGMEDVVRWMAEKTSDLSGLGAKKGRIAAGYDADLVVFDAEEWWVVGEKNLHFRHAVTPYLNERLQGRVKRTLVRGTEVFCGCEFIDSAAGRECRVNEWTTAL